MFCLKDGLVHDAVHEKPYIANIFIEDGKIVRIGGDCPDSGIKIFDAIAQEVFPGFVDAHSHIGLMGIAGNLSGDLTKDDHERSTLFTPDNKASDCINISDKAFDAAVRGGVTCVCTGPGSVNLVGGQSVAIKTKGPNYASMIVKDPVAMKMALGENPKLGLSKLVYSRATVAARDREFFTLAKKYYLESKESKFHAYSAAYEAMIPVFEKKIPMKVHALRNDDIRFAINLAKEFDFNLTLEHVKDCGLVEKEIIESGFPVCIGPYMSQPMKLEAVNGNLSDCASLIRKGCHVCVMTDAPIVSEEYLAVCAGMLLREGISEFEALKTITINAAEHLGIEDRVGSIEVGKDADLVIAKGNALLNSVKPSAVFIDGERYI